MLAGTWGNPHPEAAGRAGGGHRAGAPPADQEGGLGGSHMVLSFSQGTSTSFNT